ncbi:hypothetical protein BVAVS116_E0001 (plasmid) [Borreliella valaisiana VS116]|uniref:Uncharacterized protein n=1 Tax=Borreliella valaisiana VS116 TaxID=445987 RepID=C0R8N2_BORVA|nr:hypothetical protein BVAVS116_E0001 [Borreliella valaisiana VS116]
MSCSQSICFLEDTLIYKFPSTNSFIVLILFGGKLVSFSILIF